MSETPAMIEAHFKEDFVDAVLADPDMTDAQKIKWLHVAAKDRLEKLDAARADNAALVEALKPFAAPALNPHFCDTCGPMAPGMPHDPSCPWRIASERLAADHPGATVAVIVEKARAYVREATPSTCQALLDAIHAHEKEQGT